MKRACAPPGDEPESVEETLARLEKISPGFVEWARNLARPSGQTRPVAPLRPVIDVYFGTTVSDPYGYMVNAKDPQVRAWLKAQADYTASVLGRIPGRKALFERLWALASGTDTELHPKQPIVRLPNGQVFYHKRAAGDDVFKFYVRDTIDTAEPGITGVT